MHLHSKRCLAAAIIAAVENVRDDAESDLTFRLTAQDNTFLSLADDYLSDATMTCRCGAYEMDSVVAVLEHEGAVAATNLAAQYLADQRINTGQYIALVRQSEGRDATAWANPEGR